jgi:ADP-ribosyl-[dinitrogen reductase] hydrolase
MNLQNRYRGCLLGLACGDAVGTAVEFMPRGTFAPVTDMTGGGPFDLQPGQWTDDTSMALCLATSLVERRTFDARDQMDRYVRWWKDGYLSSTGRFFDIGIATSGALGRYLDSHDPYAGSDDPYSAGNGSLMRLAPVPMFFYPDLAAALHYAGESSRTTHAAAQCVDACRLFAAILIKAFAGQAKEEILSGPHFTFDPAAAISPAIQAIADGEYRRKTSKAITGSGYVVRSLEAALWCFDTTGSFRDAILTAANLGDDADTTAAVCGQLAGAYYGVAGIPTAWLQQLTLRGEIESLADRLLALSGAGGA